MNKKILDEDFVMDCICLLGQAIRSAEQKYVYGIPRGGTMVAVELHTMFPELEIITEPEAYSMDEVAIVDDIVCTGRTLKPWLDCGYRCWGLYHRDKYKHPNLTFCQRLEEGWYVFPWEKNVHDGEELVTRMLEYIGEDPTREGLIETPKRVVKAWQDWFAGYKQNPEDVAKIFTDDSSDEMIILRDIEFQSFCEHHLAPFTGKAHVAYIPKGKLIGASKLARIVDLYAKRLQIQERICNQVTSALEDILQPLGAACLIEAKHSCISSRGVGKQHSEFITSSLTGVFKTDPAVRDEFLRLVK